MEFDLAYLEELITLTGAVVTGVLVPLAGWFWIKVVRPLTNLLRRQEEAMEAIADIQEEIKTHGGKTIKDTMVAVRGTLSDIEYRLKVINQRTKAALNYADAALFETDNEGKLVWANVQFWNLDKGSNHTSLKHQYDWLSLLKDNEQKETLEQFKSCLAMNRSFVRHTELTDGSPIRMSGHPLRVSDDQNDGFLISITKLADSTVYESYYDSSY